MSTDALLVALEPDQLEVGVITLELARLNGRVSESRRPAAAALERSLAAALERQGAAPSVLEVGLAIDVLYRAGILTPPADSRPRRDLAHAIASRVTELETALEFYADHAQYERLGSGKPRPAGVEMGDPAIMIDRGARARTTRRRGSGA